MHFRFFIIAAILLAAAGSARSQQAWVYPSHVPCNGDLAAGFYTASVAVTTPFQFQSVRFSVPTPPGAFLANPTALGGGTVTGDFATGLEIEFPACRSAGAVLQFTLIVVSPIVDYTWVIGSYAGDATIELEDCEGFLMKGSGEYLSCGFECCEPQIFCGPYRPNPPDGATDVPVDQLLSFVGDANVLLLGADPDLREEDVVCRGEIICVFPFDPDLQPNTTYYWRALNAAGGCSDDCGSGESDLWSFTTGDATTPTVTSTWGAIKALYRD